MATKKKATRKRSTTKKRATKKKAAPRKKAAAKPKSSTSRFRVGAKYRLDGQLLKLKKKGTSVCTFILLDSKGKPIVDEAFGRQSRLPKTWIVSSRLSEVRPA